MKNLSGVGRIFYGIGIAGMGFLTIYYKDFPYMLIPPKTFLDSWPCYTSLYFRSHAHFGRRLYCFWKTNQTNFSPVGRCTSIDILFLFYPV